MCCNVGSHLRHTGHVGSLVLPNVKFSASAELALRTAFCCKILAPVGGEVRSAREAELLARRGKVDVSLNRE